MLPDQLLSTLTHGAARPLQSGPDLRREILLGAGDLEAFSRWHGRHDEGGVQRQPQLVK